MLNNALLKIFLTLELRKINGINNKFKTITTILSIAYESRHPTTFTGGISWERLTEGAVSTPTQASAVASLLHLRVEIHEEGKKCAL